MKKLMMVAVATLLSVGMFAHTAKLPVKSKTAHVTENVVNAKSVHKTNKGADKKQGDKKKHASKHATLKAEKPAPAHKK